MGLRARAICLRFPVSPNRKLRVSASGPISGETFWIRRESCKFVACGPALPAAKGVREGRGPLALFTVPAGVYGGGGFCIEKIFFQREIVPQQFPRRKLAKMAGGAESAGFCGFGKGKIAAPQIENLRRNAQREDTPLSASLPKNLFRQVEAVLLRNQSVHLERGFQSGCSPNASLASKGARGQGQRKEAKRQLLAAWGNWRMLWRCRTRERYRHRTFIEFRHTIGLSGAHCCMVLQAVCRTEQCPRRRGRGQRQCLRTLPVFRWAPVCPRIVRTPDHIVRAQLIKVAQLNQIFYFQFCPAVFDMAVTLLRFWDHFGNLRLRKVAILPDFPKPSAIVQDISPRKYRITLKNRVLIYTQRLSIMEPTGACKAGNSRRGRTDANKRQQ